MVERLQSDFDATPTALRKACTYAQALTKLQCCAGFVHFMKHFERVSPAASFKDAQLSLRSQFFSGYLDPDITHALENSFPPGQLMDIAAFRLAVLQTIALSSGLAVTTGPTKLKSHPSHFTLSRKTLRGPFSLPIL